jgi:hypothetical protein
MDDTTLQILLEMQDNATPKLRTVSTEFRKNNAAIRELSMGTAYLGSTMLGLGVAMQASNNEAVKGVGNMLAMSGGILTAVGSAAHFVNAIGKMVSALKALRVQQVLTQAFSGPAGWAMLAAGTAIAGATIYGMSRSSPAPVRTSTVNTQERVTIIQNIAGSVVAQKQLVDDVHKGLLIKQQRGTTGLQP